VSHFAGGRRKFRITPHRDRYRNYGKSRFSDNALVIMLLGVAALLARSTALIMSTEKERERERGK